jgi:dephospho-CoA kinase
MIRARALAEVAASSSPYTLLVVPLLLETGCYADLIQRILVVDCPEPLQISRTRQRSQLDETSIRAIMAHQFPRLRRLESAHDIILNDSDLPALRQRVLPLHERYLALADGII